MKALRRRLQTLLSEQQVLWANLFGGGSLTVGHEIVRPADRYHWDGVDRQSDPAQPMWLFQYTLEGWGRLEVMDKIHDVPEGHAFVVRIPSAHYYQADPTCKRWEFCWLMIRLPEIHLRFSRHQSLTNAVLPMDSESPIMLAFAELAHSISRRDVDFLLEQRLFDWALSLERASYSSQYPDEPRRRLLREVREWVLRNLPSSTDVTALAAEHRLSRSNFSHRFRMITGRPPAAYMREVRLEAAAGLLQSDKLSVKEIAASTGFSDANRLCKAFRAQYQLSPGEYRRLAGWRRLGGN